MINQYFHCTEGQSLDSNRQYGYQMTISLRQFHTYTFQQWHKDREKL